MNDELNFFLDLLARIDRGDRFSTPKEMSKVLKEQLPGYEGSYVDGMIISDHLASIAKSFKDEFKDMAYAEFLMQHGEEKSEHKGVTITPSEGYAKYDYPQDKYLTKYEAKAKEIKEDMKPFTDKLDAIKNSIKERKKTLESDGSAKLLSTTKTLKFDRK